MKPFLFIAFILLSGALFAQEDFILFAENVKKSSEQKIHNGDKVIVKLEGGHKAKGELEILSETNIKVGESILAVDAIQVFEFSTPGQFRRTKISKNICFITAGVGVGVFTAGLIYANNTSGLDFSGITLMALGAGMTTVGTIGGTIINTQKYRNQSLRKSLGWTFKIKKS